LFVGEDKDLIFAYEHFEGDFLEVNMQVNSVDFSFDNELLAKQYREQLASSHPRPKSGKDEEDVESTPSNDLENLRTALAEHNITLKFRTDDTTHSLVVEMIDDQTGEEIRQFPTEVSLHLAANFVKLQGQFLDKMK
jgi:uncharacterized FlaG/YvyC family protein